MEQRYIDIFRRALIQAYPDRTGILDVQFEGSYAQAWQAFARILGVNTTELARVVAPVFGIEVSGLQDEIAADTVALLPFNHCLAHTILPLRQTADEIVIATANPHDEDVNERTLFLLDKQVRWVLAPPEAIEDAIVTVYSKEAARAASTPGAESGEESRNRINENTVVKLGQSLIQQAILERASDLHIQPFLGAASVRIRVDGDLRRLTMLQDAVASTLIRHIKARCGMDPSNSIIPQDGRMSIIVDDRDFNLRVSTLPASRGERLVIRFLDQGRVHRLNKSGFSLAALQTLRRMIARPSGLILVTGPTGSGKTSTLYGMLTELNRSTVNVITVENPVEYRLPGISQVDVNDKSGRSFAAVLRSILRQDPDIILIGEIRDQETAEIATQAALTGHLVLSTLHANDSLSTIPRLLGLGIQPTILADALVGVISQRLCRMLCARCKAEVTEPYTEDEQLFHRITRHYPAHRPMGCNECGHTGFRGRIPLVDMLEVTPRLREAISLGTTSLSELQPLREGGLQSMAVSASRRIISGETTVMEAFETMGLAFWNELAAHYETQMKTDDLDSFIVALGSEPGVLIISQHSGLISQTGQCIQAEGYRMFHCPDTESAGDLLRREESITFVVLDIPDLSDLDSAKELLRRSARNLYWSRLPALVLFPSHLASHEPEFRDNGMISPCLTKPVDLHQFMQRIRKGQAR